MNQAGRSDEQRVKETSNETFYERLDRIERENRIARLFRNRPENLHDYQGCANAATAKLPKEVPEDVARAFNNRMKEARLPKAEAVPSPTLDFEFAINLIMQWSISANADHDSDLKQAVKILQALHKVAAPPVEEEDDPLCQLSSCGHPLSMHDDSEGCCTAPSDFSQKDYGGDIGVQPTPCICSKFRSTPEATPQTFEEVTADDEPEIFALLNLHRANVEASSSPEAKQTFMDTMRFLLELAKVRHAAKASSPVVAGREREKENGRAKIGK